jgi:hypothetical protein
MTDATKEAISRTEKARVAVLDALSVPDTIGYVLIDHLQRTTIEEFRLREDDRKAEFLRQMSEAVGEK